MNILWFSWKDRRHPLAGGAETVSGQLMDNLVRDGHNVRLITSGYEGGLSREKIDGIKIFRVGNRYTVYYMARKLYMSDMSDWPDLIIDEMNTIPFGCATYAKVPAILLTYQLAREVWLYQLPIPFSWIGYLIEPIYLRLISKKYSTVITESASTQKDLARHGFREDRIKIFRVGMDIKPLVFLAAKKDMATVLSLGSIRPMKRTLDAVKAFECARDNVPSLRMVIAGDSKGAYAQKVLSHIQKSRHAENIHVEGRVSDERRTELMGLASVIVVTSIKEGWGLIVTEANSQGTPAVAYDADGLRDSIQDNQTGLLAPNGNYKLLGEAMSHLLSNPERYEQLRRNGWEWSKEFSIAASYEDFKRAISLE